MARTKRKKTVFTQQFSTKFKQYVKAKEDTGLKREEIAAGIGITPSQLFNFENDLATPMIDTLHNICKYFDVSADYMLGLSPAENLTGDIKTTEYTTGLSKDAICFLQTLAIGKCDDCLMAINALLSEKRFDDCRKYWENIYVFLSNSDKPFQALLANGIRKFSADDVLAIMLSENEQYLRKLRREIKKVDENKRSVGKEKKEA